MGQCRFTPLDQVKSFAFNCSFALQISSTKMLDQGECPNLTAQQVILLNKPVSIYQYTITIIMFIVVIHLSNQTGIPITRPGIICV